MRHIMKTIMLLRRLRERAARLFLRPASITLVSRPAAQARVPLREPAG